MRGLASGVGILRCRYSGWMFAACLPFGPVLTSKETRWFSFNDLNPSERISEKWANRSSPPASEVIKPKPLASLNHFTIPVSIYSFLKFVLTQVIQTPNPNAAISASHLYGRAIESSRPCLPAYWGIQTNDACCIQKYCGWCTY